jgi:hypothetical protein
MVKNQTEVDCVYTILLVSYEVLSFLVNFISISLISD